jgi:hypothetical protein
LKIKEISESLYDFDDNVKAILEQTEFKETALANIDGHTIFSILMSKKCWKQL